MSIVINSYKDCIDKSLQKQLLDSINYSSLLYRPKDYINLIVQNNKTEIKKQNNYLFWINGQYAYGLWYSHSKTDIKILKKFYDRILLLYNRGLVFFDKPDSLIHAYVILKLYKDCNQQKYITLINAAKNYILNEFNTNILIRYRSFSSKFYIDALGMMNDFCYEYRQQFNDKEIMYFADRQMDTIIRLCEKNSTMLPYHVYDMESDTFMGPNTWGRGIGWYIIGLTASAINNPKKYKIQYNRAIDSIFLHQNLDGFFYDDFEKENHIDTSITSMASLALAKGLLYGLFEEDAVEGKKAKLALSVKALMHSVNEKGHVMNSSGECEDVGKYSSKFGNYFAQGYTLALFCILPNIMDTSNL